MTTSTLQLFIAAASLAAALPPIVDGWLASRIKGPKALAFAIMVVGLIFGSGAGLLTQLGNGAAFGDAETVAFVGLVSGFATGLQNWSKANELSKDRTFVPPPMKPPMLPILFVLIACAAWLAMTVVGCITPKTPAQQESDGETVLACVEANWGLPLPTVALNCTGGIIAVAEDGVADLEALFESRASSAGVDAGAFPYANDLTIVSKVASKVALIRGRHALVDAGAP
jgi:MFS family permease